MGMNTPRTEAERRRYAETLADDLPKPRIRPKPEQTVEAQRFLRDMGDGPSARQPDLHSALPLGRPEFNEHQCWTMLMIWPSEEDPSRPDRAVCQGCGSAWRLEEEYRP